MLQFYCFPHRSWDVQRQCECSIFRWTKKIRFSFWETGSTVIHNKIKIMNNNGT